MIICWGTLSIKFQVIGQIKIHNTSIGSNYQWSQFRIILVILIYCYFNYWKYKITYAEKRKLHTKGTESSAETTIDDIQIATTADVPNMRAEYDLSESNCRRTSLRIICNWVIHQKLHPCLIHHMESGITKSVVTIRLPSLPTNQPAWPGPVKYYSIHPNL